MGNRKMKCFFNRFDVAMARGVFTVEVEEEPVILGRGKLLGIEENCVSRQHAELRSISCGLIILKCTHRRALIIEKEDGKEVVLEEGNEAVLSPGNIVKFNLDKYHYKVEDNREKDE